MIRTLRWVLMPTGSGELLLDQQRFQEAVDKFDRAIEIENERPKYANLLCVPQQN